MENKRRSLRKRSIFPQEFMIEFLTDPILRAPTWASIFLCASSALMGAILFFQRKLLFSESISHAAYPGAVIGILFLAVLGPEYESFSFLAVLLGALGSSWLGARMLKSLEKKVSSDSSLCFTLAIFFGFGVLLVSLLQEMFPMWISQVQALLYGQAATLTDIHILIYGILALGSILLIGTQFHSLQALLFDRTFAKSIGIKVKLVERLLFWLLLLSVVAGIRSVGVILISAMLIGPSIAARQWSNRLQTVFILSAVIGAISGLLGNIISVQLAIPTGPAIVLVSSAFAVLSLLFAPKRGALFRVGRQVAFRLRCMEENVLKSMWKTNRLHCSSKYVLFRLRRHGWIEKEGSGYCLTEDGKSKAAAVVRLHRLWELYLTEKLGLKAEKVHANAEEMEHILTPEIEERLTKLLANPAKDPHEQPIPERLIL